MPILPSEKSHVALAAVNALNNASVSDAAVNALTDAAGLVALILNQTAKTADQTEDYRRWSQDIQKAIDALILTDANVGASTTKAAVITILINSSDVVISASQQGGAHFTA